jgi:hypothetical protein
MLDAEILNPLVLNARQIAVVRVVIVRLHRVRRAGGRGRRGGLGRESRLTRCLKKDPKTRLRDIGEARKQGLINDSEAAQLKETADAVAAAIGVDDFSAEELTHHDAQRAQGDRPSPAQRQQRPTAAE